MSRESGSNSTYAHFRDKLFADQVFLLASALSFNALVALLPILLLAASALGIIAEISSQAEMGARAFVRTVWPTTPGTATDIVDALQADRGWIGAAGLVGLLWAAMRYVTTLRQVLDIVFDVPKTDRLDYLPGKAHDALMVGLGGLLFGLTVATTTLFLRAGDIGVNALAAWSIEVPLLTTLLGYVLGFGVTVAMFYVLYRFVSNRRVSRFDAVIAAIFTGVLFEIAKVVAVLSLVAPQRLTPYGSFSGLVALALWVYYTNIVVILGAELANARRRARLETL